MAKTKLKDLLGWTIEVDEAGKFTATRPPSGGRYRTEVISRVNLKALEREITKRVSGTVRVMRWPFRPPEEPSPDRPRQFLHSGTEVPFQALTEPTTISGVESDGVRVRMESGDLQSPSQYAVWDEAAALKVADFVRRRKEMLAALDQEFWAWLREVKIETLTYAGVERLLRESQAATEAAAAPEADGES